jgi:hypothetical protein
LSDRSVVEYLAAQVEALKRAQALIELIEPCFLPLNVWQKVVDLDVNRTQGVIAHLIVVGLEEAGESNAATE